MIAALRTRGIAARFVSGYLHLADDDDDGVPAAILTPGSGLRARIRAGSTAIRRQAPWEIKTSSGSRSLTDASETIPLQGTWFGTAADHRAMKVAVKVTAAAASRRGITRTAR